MAKTISLVISRPRWLVEDWMRIDWAIACERTALLADGRPCAIGIHSLETPWVRENKVYVVSFLIRLLYDQSDPLPEHTLKLQILGPSNRYQNLATFLIRKPTYANFKFIEGVFPLDIPSAGMYALHFLIDDQHVEDAPSVTINYVQVANLADPRQPGPRA